jgi:predicted transcriptional regulator
MHKDGDPASTMARPGALFTLVYSAEKVSRSKVNIQSKNKDGDGRPVHTYQRASSASNI